MTCGEYKSLDEQGQIRALHIKGVCVAERKDNDCRYLLYQIDGFYIEIKYGLKNSCRQAVNIFENTRLLEPYLDAINVPAGL